VTSPQIENPLKTLEVTGELDPDATGTYEDAGEYGGKRYYQRTPNGVSLWWSNVGYWCISGTLGMTGIAFWVRIDPNIEGDYSAEGEADGVATVTQI